MLDGADRTEDGPRVLMYPRRSIELLEERRGRQPGRDTAALASI